MLLANSNIVSPLGHPVADRIILDLFPENEHLRRWITLAQERVAFQGFHCA